MTNTHLFTHSYYQGESGRGGWMKPNNYIPPPTKKKNKYSIAKRIFKITGLLVNIPTRLYKGKEKKIFLADSHHHLG